MARCDPRDPYDTAHIVGRGLEALADELDGGEGDAGDEDGEDEEAADLPAVVRNGASRGGARP